MLARPADKSYYSIRPFPVAKRAIVQVFQDIDDRENLLLFQPQREIVDCSRTVFYQMEPYFLSNVSLRDAQEKANRYESSTL